MPPADSITAQEFERTRRIPEAKRDLQRGTAQAAGYAAPGMPNIPEYLLPVLQAMGINMNINLNTNRADNSSDMASMLASLAGR